MAKSRDGGAQDPFGRPLSATWPAGSRGRLLISLLGVYLVGRLGKDEAIRDAKDLTRATAERAIEPALTDDLLSRRPGRARPLRRSRPQSSPTRLARRPSEALGSHRPDRLLGRARLIGARYPLGAEELAEFRGNGGRCGGQRPLEAREPVRAQFREAARGLCPRHDASGEPLRYEEYYRSGFVDARGRRIFREFAFMMLGALILLGSDPAPPRMASRASVARVSVSAWSSCSGQSRPRSWSGAGSRPTSTTGSYRTSPASRTRSPRQPVRRPRSSRPRSMRLRPRRGRDPGAAQPARRDLSAGAAARGPGGRARRPARAVRFARIGRPAFGRATASCRREVEALFFRAAQEALRNVVKHAGAHGSRWRWRGRTARSAARRGRRRRFRSRARARSVAFRPPAPSATSSARPAATSRSTRSRVVGPRSGSRSPFDPVAPRRGSSGRPGGPRAVARNGRRHRGRRGGRGWRAGGRARGRAPARRRAHGPLDAQPERASRRRSRSRRETTTCRSSCSRPSPTGRRSRRLSTRGAIGYLLKDAEPEEVIRGVRAAARGESPLAPKAARALRLLGPVAPSFS